MQCLKQSVNELLQQKNIGQQKIKALNNAGIYTYWDLLTYYPRKITTVSKQTLTIEGSYIAIKCKMLKLIRKSTGKIKFMIEIEDEFLNKGKILFFTKQLPFTFIKDAVCVVQGKCEGKTFIHPKILPENTKYIIQYFLKPPLFDSTFQSLVKSALQDIKQPLSTNLQNILHAQNWQDFFQQLHFSPSYYKALEALKILESIAYQKILSDTNKQHNTIPTMKEINPKLLDKYQQLQNTLTTCQQKALKHIVNDFQQTKTTSRIIFGDVGTGKTRLMIMAAMHAISANKQVVFLAPTSLLAQQVYEVFTHTLLDTNIQLVTQKTKKHYQKNGQIFIGTHAIFQDSMQYVDIGLVIIDEQHKFGVLQRQKLVEKAPNAHLLLLSATPIPRTLMLVMQKYLGVSLLQTKPKPTQITTSLVSAQHIEELIYHLQLELNNNPNTLIYWICPAVSDEEDELQYMNVESRHAILQASFLDKVAILHGKMKPDQQQAVYQQIQEHQVQILVATTVVEVGIDIPHAHIIIIEDANRFGLAQLHQLRGRVGRAGQPGKCILLYPKNLSEVGRKRLTALKNHSSGFELAEQDMKIRGHGKLFGSEQTGFNEFSFLQLPHDTDLLNQAQQYYSAMTQDEFKLLKTLFFLDSALKAG